MKKKTVKKKVSKRAVELKPAAAKEREEKRKAAAEKRRQVRIAKRKLELELKRNEENKKGEKEFTTDFEILCKKHNVKGVAHIVSDKRKHMFEAGSKNIKPYEALGILSLNGFTRK